MRIFLKILAILFCASSVCAKECESKYAAVIFDEKNNQILYENRAELLIYPASLTKIMTLYLVFEALENGRLKLYQKIPVSTYAQDVSHINKITTLNLMEGDEISVQDAILGTAAKSFNGTAVVLAEAVAGDEWNFVKMMNEKAKKMRMYHTNFRNSTGLHADGHYSTAYDLARLMIAMKHKFPQYLGYFARKTFVYQGKEFVNHNHFLHDYEGANGFKTGFTSKAGFNLMASAKRGETRLGGVIVSCESFEMRDSFMQELFDEGFLQLKRRDRRERRVYLDSVF